MSPSDSEEDNVEDIDFDNDEDAELDAEEDTLDMDATEDADEDSVDDSEEASDDDDDDDDDDETGPLAPPEQSSGDTSTQPAAPIPTPNGIIASLSGNATPSPTAGPSPLPMPRRRSLSPVQLRKASLSVLATKSAQPTRSFTVEAICALPHPVPTHAIAASYCMTHLITGSDDGYIRDYDIFTAVNSKNFLTAPQRHHSGVVEGIMKAGQLRCWWENPPPPAGSKMKDGTGEDDNLLSPVYSLSMHSDALWMLAGTDSGNINLFTVRHDPGRLIHLIQGHRGPVSALCLDFDEKGFISAGWDGEAIQWDLNTGNPVRHFTAHGAQLTAVALRPMANWWAEPGSSIYSGINEGIEMPVDSNQLEYKGEAALRGVKIEDQPQREDKSQPVDSDTKSDISYDPLFDDEPDSLTHDAGDHTAAGKDDELAAASNVLSARNSEPPVRVAIPPPKNAPPLLDATAYATYSPNILMTAYIDGQVVLWDRRTQTAGKGVGRLWMSEKTPPWCLSACWSADGNQLYAGRRNGTVDVWDVRLLGRSGPLNTPRVLKTLRNPSSSGVVSCVVGLPDSRHIACASVDNLRLWNVAESAEQEITNKVKGVQFKIIPGHHGGYVSQMIVDAGARFLVSASSNRGWHGESTKTVFVHDIKHVMAA